MPSDQVVRVDLNVESCLNLSKKVCGRKYISCKRTSKLLLKGPCHNVIFTCKPHGALLCEKVSK